MNRVTRAGRVTSDAGPEADRVTSIVGKKALCAHLGWSRPALDRRLRWDKNFPLLHCGKPGEAWRFDLHAVVAHVESSSGRRGRSLGTAGRRPGVPVLAISHELERALAIKHMIAELLVELSTLLERINTALGFEGAPATPTRESVDGDSH